MQINVTKFSWVDLPISSKTAYIYWSATLPEGAGNMFD
jgi:hypothetical protein